MSRRAGLVYSWIGVAMVVMSLPIPEWEVVLGQGHIWTPDVPL